MSSTGIQPVFAVVVVVGCCFDFGSSSVCAAHRPVLPATRRTRTAEVLAAQPRCRTKVHRCSGAADGGRHGAESVAAGDAEVVVATWQHMLSLL